MEVGIERDDFCLGSYMGPDGWNVSGDGKYAVVRDAKGDNIPSHRQPLTAQSFASYF
jgi:hypothetical protein